MFFKRLSYITLGLIALLLMVPVGWAVLSAFRPPRELASGFGEVHFTLDNFAIAFGQTELVTWLINSAFISIVTTVMGLFFAALAAFSLARHTFAGARFVFLLIVVSISIPEYVTLIPSFLIARNLGILNTFWAVILPLVPHGMTVFLLRQYFLQLPAEIFEAARMDGANEFRAFWQIALPMVRPGLAAAAILLFLFSWNAYLLPLVMLRSNGLETVPVGLATLYANLSLGNPPYDPWSAITAATVISILPLAILLIAMQRHFVSGLTAGAVK